MAIRSYEDIEKFAEANGDNWPDALPMDDARRTAWIICNSNKPIPLYTDVVSTCDEQKCVNPDHLRLVTIERIQPSVIDRYWKYTDVQDDDTYCWEWTRAKTPGGYGVLNDRKKIVRMTRVAWGIHYNNGFMPPENKHVCHSCDNPSCVNPNHLWLGDHRSNGIDSSLKGRARGGQPPSENHPRAKVSDDQMIAIQREYAASGTTASALATKYGCSKKTVLNIIHGRCRIGNTLA